MLCPCNQLFYVRNSYPNNENNMPDSSNMSDIKSAHLGHHVREGGILAEFLKIRCTNGKASGSDAS